MPFYTTQGDKEANCKSTEANVQRGEQGLYVRGVSMFSSGTMPSRNNNQRHQEADQNCQHVEIPPKEKLCLV